MQSDKPCSVCVSAGEGGGGYLATQGDYPENVPVVFLS